MTLHRERPFAKRRLPHRARREPRPKSRTAE